MAGIKEQVDQGIANRLGQVVQNMWGSMVEHLPGFMQRAREEAEKQAPKPDSKFWNNWADNLVESGFVDADTAELIKGVKDYNFPLNIIAYAVVPLMIMLRDLGTNLDIYGLDRQYAAQAKTTPHPAPIDNLVRSMIIDPGRSTENRAELKKHGFSDTQIDNIVLSYYQMLDVGTVRTNYLRGHITSDKMYERLRELGFTDTRIAEMVQTWEVLPGPQDLFTMVAHEAFEPEIYKKIGLETEFPAEQVEWLKAQGISEAWALKWWIAHWQEPSIGQGYEMLHRGQIDLDDLNLLYKTVEIPPYWRDKLTAIAYAPLTRVDVRRMHDLGVIDDEKLIRSYMDLGYNQENAELLAEFTIKYNSDEERTATKATILQAYHDGIISRIEAKTLLTQQAYSDETASFYLELEDYNLDKEVQDIQVGIIKDTFLAGGLEEKTARDSLAKIGIRGEKIDALVDQWIVQLYKHETLPSKTELAQFFSQGIIDRDTWTEYMTRHGYSAQAIGWYLSLLQAEMEQPERQPSRTDLETWLKKKIITEEEWRSGMADLGYTPEQIDNYFKEI